MRIILTCSGVVRMSTDVISELMHDDLPAPVWPAMSRWGMVARSTRMFLPLMSRPSATSRALVARWASSDASTSPSEIT